MSFWLYNALWQLVAPIGRIYLGCTRHRTLLQRFHPVASPFNVRPILIHACSVGEVASALTLRDALRIKQPDAPVLLTVATASAYKFASERLSAKQFCWFPFDQGRTVRQFLDDVSPSIIVLIETEIWPNMIREATRRDISVVVVNGRISDTHFRRYKRFPGLFARVFGQIRAIGAQEPRYAERFITLGAQPSRVTVTGSGKFDSVTTEVEPRVRAALRSECRFGEDPLLVFGSTRPGDELLALECYHKLRETLPHLRLLVAPRHPVRVPEILDLISEPVVLRSHVRVQADAQNARIFILDTIGELPAFYSIATIAVVGGSFFPGVDGHNPLEPSALGIPTVFGPYMGNFQDPADVLLTANAAIQVTHPSELCDVLAGLLANQPEQRQLGNRSRKAVLDNRGATERSIELVLRHLASVPASGPLHQPSN